MSGNASMDANGTPSSVTLLQMMTGYWISQAIYVAAKLGIADLITDRPVSYEELAAATNSHAPSLSRVLRSLASIGVFAEADAAFVHHDDYLTKLFSTSSHRGPSRSTRWAVVIRMHLPHARSHLVVQMQPSA